MTVSSKSFHQKLLIHLLEKSRNSRNPLEKGFTLIELLVVLVIIAILTAIGITQYNGVIKSAAIQGARVLVSADAKQCAGALVSNDPTLFVGTDSQDARIAYTAPTCSPSATFSAATAGFDPDVTCTSTMVGGFPTVVSCA